MAEQKKPAQPSNGQRQMSALPISEGTPSPVVGLSVKKSDEKTSPPVPARKKTRVVGDAQLSMPQWRGKKAWSETDNPILKKKPRIVIAVAGMRHCGSTALFNVIRLGLLAEGFKVHSGYSGSGGAMEQIPKGQGVVLTKVHEFRDDVANMCDVIFDVRRDLRDTVASAKRRKFANYVRLGASEYASYNRMLHDMWHPYADMSVEFADLVDDLTITCEKVFHFLGLSKADPRNVSYMVRDLPTDQYPDTLLSREHVTDPDRLLSYQQTLSPSDIRMIEMKNQFWLSKYGYLKS